MASVKYEVGPFLRGRVGTGGPISWLGHFSSVMLKLDSHAMIQGSSQYLESASGAPILRIAVFGGIWGRLLFTEISFEAVSSMDLTSRVVEVLLTPLHMTMVQYLEGQGY